MITLDDPLGVPYFQTKPFGTMTSCGISQISTASSLLPVHIAPSFVAWLAAYWLRHLLPCHSAPRLPQKRRRLVMALGANVRIQKSLHQHPERSHQQLAWTWCARTGYSTVSLHCIIPSLQLVESSSCASRLQGENQLNYLNCLQRCPKCQSRSRQQEAPTILFQYCVVTVQFVSTGQTKPIHIKKSRRCRKIPKVTVYISVCSTVITYKVI